ncbi:MAG TPA: hypothetical protein VF170_04020, partial [Planctomycetaceae bacterium]
HAEVTDRDYVDSRVRLRCRLPKAFARRMTIDEGELLPDTTVTWLDGSPEATGTAGHATNGATH